MLKFHPTKQHCLHLNLCSCFQSSFLSIPTWITEVRRHAPDDAVIMLVGNKVDLVKEQAELREVTQQVKL